MEACSSDDVESSLGLGAGGWGLGRAGDTYTQWFEPLDQPINYLNLINSHFTWMVELGWLGSIAYLFFWGLVFKLAWPMKSSRLSSLPLASWITFFVGACFSSVAESPYLWIAPILFLGYSLWIRFKLKVWPRLSFYGYNLGVASACVGLLLLVGAISSPGIIYSNDNDVRIGSGPLTQTDRLQLISLLKKSHIDPQSDFHQIRRSLLVLDDSDTITSAVMSHREFDITADYDLSTFGTERVIDYLGEDLELPESAQYHGGGDVYYPPTREVSSSIILAIVIRSKLFPKATSEWASTLGNAPSPGLWRIILEWWNHNKEPILAHKYQNATWLSSDLASPNTPTTEIVEDVVLTGNLHALTYLRPNQKEQAIALLKKSNPLADNDFNQITQALLTLDDIDTINTTMAKYHRFDSLAGALLFEQANEIVIERLGEDLSLPVSERDTNNRDSHPTREDSASIILGILERSTLFGKPNSIWAQSTVKLYPNSWKPVFEWWQHNKEAILAHKYSEATWLPAESTPSTTPQPHPSP